MEKENVLDVLAQRFCATRLPESVAADLCASQPGPGRYGTNLLTVAQARQMLGQVLAEVLDEEWFEQLGLLERIKVSILDTAERV